MVTGFALVLYSRLHLLKPSKLLLRIAMICIIADAILFHGSIVVITTMFNVSPSPLLVRIYRCVAYTELAFSVQEAVIAALYIYLFAEFTKDSIREASTRKALLLLVLAECVVLSTDIVLCVLLYLKYYLPRQMLQTWCSILKLQIEFLILNWLQKFSQLRANRLDLGSWQRGDYNLDASDFITAPFDGRESQVQVAGAVVALKP